MQLLLASAVVLLASSCGDSLGPEDSNHPALDVALVEIEPDDLSLGEGRSQQLRAVARDENGDTVPSVSISWHSTDTTLATVQADGTVRGLRRGAAKIVARSGDHEGEAALEVRAPLEALSVATPPGAVNIGDRVRLEITLVTTEGDTVSSSRVRVSWSSSDTAVASVDPEGWVTGIGAGTATITARSEGAKGQQEVHVADGPPGGWRVTVRPSRAVLYAIDESVQLTAELTDATGEKVEDVDFTWKSLDTQVATVTKAGKVTARALGTALIVAAAYGASDTTTVEVQEAPAPPPGTLPAFPGAEGWGATALQGCRELPLVVHKVTNTNDSGPGSLRDILENRVRPDRYDIVIFRTGGLIRLQRIIREHRLNCLYIAGQTAPGGGISIVGAPIEFRRSDDLVVRHLRHRGHSSTAFRVRGGHRIIFDQITASWAGASTQGGANIIHLVGQTNLNIPYPLEGATIQNSLIYEPDRRHPTLLVFQGLPRDPVPPISKISAHRNVLIGPGHRTPMCSALEVSFANNVVYNWVGRAAENDATASCDYTANYYKPGPAAPRGGLPILVGDTCQSGDCSFSIHVADNRNHHNGYGSVVGNPWEGHTREVGCRKVASGTWCPANGAIVPQQFRRSRPLPPPEIPVYNSLMDDSNLDNILAAAGHSRRLACSAAWESVRDPVDAERIQFFYSGTGPSSYVSVDNVPLPVPTPGSPCSDTDGDGIPDEYEIRHSGTPVGLSPGALTKSGYLVIELYLAGKDPSWIP